MKHDRSLHSGHDKLSLTGRRDLARLALALAQAGGITLPIILCCYTGPMPKFAAPMPRDPSPAVGAPFDELFAKILAEALMHNQTVHDGAIMLGRAIPDGEYRITGWSYRLHPPAANAIVFNKGSAFNSCGAMSSVLGVDALYLISRDGTFAFRNGGVDKIDT